MKMIVLKRILQINSTCMKSYRIFNLHTKCKALHTNAFTYNLAMPIVHQDFHHKSLQQIKCFNSNECVFITSCLNNVKRNYGMKIPAKKVKKGAKPKVHLTREEMEQLISVDEMNQEMFLLVETLKQDYIKHLNIRTTVGAFDSLFVEFENQKYPLKEIAQISRKGSQLIVINVSAFPTAIPSILQALNESGMNLNPQQEGTTLYVSIPMVTKEHRENLAKSAKNLFMKNKDAIREIQQNYIKIARKQKDEFSEDLIFNTQQQIIATADDYISKAEKMMLSKQEELIGTPRK